MKLTAVYRAIEDKGKSDFKCKKVVLEVPDKGDFSRVEKAIEEATPHGFEFETILYEE
jgi:hypothetical protein